MERTLISWNLPNWFTIFLMGAGTWVVIAILAQIAMRAGIYQPSQVSLP